jgi:hypothetical protein
MVTAESVASSAESEWWRKVGLDPKLEEEREPGDEPGGLEGALNTVGGLLAPPALLERGSSAARRVARGSAAITQRAEGWKDAVQEAATCAVGVAKIGVSATATNVADGINVCIGWLGRMITARLRRLDDLRNNRIRSQRFAAQPDAEFINNLRFTRAYTRELLSIVKGQSEQDDGGHTFSTVTMDMMSQTLCATVRRARSCSLLPSFFFFFFFFLNFIFFSFALSAPLGSLPRVEAGRWSAAGRCQSPVSGWPATGPGCRAAFDAEIPL